MRSGTNRRLRVAVAKRAGCIRGDDDHEVAVTDCPYCGVQIVISWLGDDDGPRFVYATYQRDGSIRYAAAHLDHVMPESRNGPTSLDNTVAACAPCNLAKGASTLGDRGFVRWLSTRREAVRQGDAAFGVWCDARMLEMAALPDDPTF